MLFWKNKQNQFWPLFFLSFCTEIFILFYFCGFKFLLIIFFLLPLHLLITSMIYKSFWIHSHIANSFFFYLKLISLTYIFKVFFPHTMKLFNVYSILLGCLFAFFVSIFLKLIFSIGFYKHSNTILFGSRENLEYLFNYFPSKVRKIISNQDVNYLDLIKKEIDNNAQSILIDNLKNYIDIIGFLNGNFINLDYTCLEIGNKKPFDVFFEQNMISVEIETVTHNFFGARILIIGNNEELISSFIYQSYKLECTSVTLITDCYQIFQKFENICKSIFFEKDIKFRDIESKYAFDIIFDTYIIRNYNFRSYRAIFAELNDVIKNKKAIVSLTKQGIFFDEWLLNLSKEIILKKFYDNCYGLTLVSFRISEFSSSNFFETSKDKNILLQDFAIQNPESIAALAWKTLWTIEKGSFNILSHLEMNSKKISSKIPLRMFEIETKSKIQFEIFNHHSYDSYQMLNKFFCKHENLNHQTKRLAEKMLTKEVITLEEIGKAIFQ